jgi:hypothetical protein
MGDGVSTMLHGLGETFVSSPEEASMLANI